MDKIVADYMNISMLEVKNIDLVDYLIARRDAFIMRMSKTEKGMEYLNNAFRVEQTEPDRDRLKEHFGGGHGR